jgi:hypothetical protein
MGSTHEESRISSAAGVFPEIAVAHGVDAPRDPRIQSARKPAPGDDSATRYWRPARFKAKMRSHSPTFIDSFKRRQRPQIRRAHARGFRRRHDLRQRLMDGDSAVVAAAGEAGEDRREVDPPRVVQRNRVVADRATRPCRQTRAAIGRQELVLEVDGSGGAQCSAGRALPAPSSAEDADRSCLRLAPERYVKRQPDSCNCFYRAWSLAELLADEAPTAGPGVIDAKDAWGRILISISSSGSISTVPTSFGSPVPTRTSNCSPDCNASRKVLQASLHDGVHLP